MSSEEAPTKKPAGSVPPTDLPKKREVEQEAKQAASSKRVRPLTALIGSLPLDKFYINGIWVDPVVAVVDASPTFFYLIDPSTARIAAEVALGSPNDVSAAVLAAKEAWPSWNYDTSPQERQRLVRRLIDVYTKRMEDMALLVSTEMGSPIVAARSSHVFGGLVNIKSALRMFTKKFESERPLPNIYPDDGDKQLTTILYEAVGVVGMITPWNWPLNQITLVSLERCPFERKSCPTLCS